MRSLSLSLSLSLSKLLNSPTLSLLLIQGLRAQIRKLHENLKVTFHFCVAPPTHSLLWRPQEEMKKLESGMQLEMNLEKGRLREESTNLSQRIKDTHNRIETEVQTASFLPSPYFFLASNR